MILKIMVYIDSKSYVIVTDDIINQFLFVYIKRKALILIFSKYFFFKKN
jgi:hypothetical protein